MTPLNMPERSFWVASHAAPRAHTRSPQASRLLPIWRLLKPPKRHPELGHAATLAPVAASRVKPALTDAIRKVLVEVGSASRDVVIFQFGPVEPDRARAALLAGLTPALVRPGWIATTLRHEQFLLELTLARNGLMAVKPWVPGHSERAVFEGDLAAMDLTWFTFMREGIDTVTIGVARLMPTAWPSSTSPEKLAVWLATLFVDEINPTLPTPFRLSQQPLGIDTREIREARRLLTDILRIEPSFAGERSASLSFSLPNGPFGLARFDRQAPGVPPEAAERLAVLVGMAIEDIRGRPENIDQSLHPDLAPRRQGELAGNLMVTLRDGASAHKELAAHARVAALYAAKRTTWLRRWKDAAPDGQPISNATIAELDRWLLPGDTSAAA